MDGFAEVLGLVVALATGAAMTVSAIKGPAKPTRGDWALLALGCLLMAFSGSLLVLLYIGWIDLAAYHPIRTGAGICTISVTLVLFLWFYLRRRFPDVSDPSPRGPAEPQLELGDPIRVPGFVKVSGPLRQWQGNVGWMEPDRGDVKAQLWRIPVVNHGSRAEVRVRVTKIAPDIADMSTPSVRSLHIEGDPKPYRDSVVIDRDGRELFDLISQGRMSLDERPELYPGQQGFLHNIRGLGDGVEAFHHDGDLYLTVTAYAGDMNVSRTYHANMAPMNLEVTAADNETGNPVT